MPDHSIPSQRFAVPCITLLILTLVLASRERVATQFPFLSQLHSGKMAVEGKGAFQALMHAHAAWQTQILASQPKNVVLGALCAGRPDVQMLSTMGPGSSAWWEQALMMPRCPFSLGERPPACSSMPGCQYISAALQSVSE